MPSPNTNTQKPSTFTKFKKEPSNNSVQNINSKNFARQENHQNRQNHHLLNNEKLINSGSVVKITRKRKSKTNLFAVFSKSDLTKTNSESKFSFDHHQDQDQNQNQNSATNFIFPARKLKKSNQLSSSHSSKSKVVSIFKSFNPKRRKSQSNKSFDKIINKNSSSKYNKNNENNDNHFLNFSSLSITEKRCTTDNFQKYPIFAEDCDFKVEELSERDSSFVRELQRNNNESSFLTSDMNHLNISAVQDKNNNINNNSNSGFRIKETSSSTSGRYSNSPIFFDNNKQAKASTPQTSNNLNFRDRINQKKKTYTKKSSKKSAQIHRLRFNMVNEILDDTNVSLDDEKDLIIKTLLENISTLQEKYYYLEVENLSMKKMQKVYQKQIHNLVRLVDSANARAAAATATAGRIKNINHINRPRGHSNSTMTNLAQIERQASLSFLNHNQQSFSQLNSSNSNSDTTNSSIFNLSNISKSSSNNSNSSTNNSCNLTNVSRNQFSNISVSFQENHHSFLRNSKKDLVFTNVKDGLSGQIKSARKLNTSRVGEML